MIVNALLSVIILSIMYYFSVVILEISTLLAASRKAKLAKLKGVISPTAKKLTGDDALRDANRFHEDELTAGGMDTQQNPLLLRAGSLNLGKKDKSKPGLTQEARQLADGFCELEDRLPPHLWPAFQATFAEVATASSGLAEAIASAKKRIQDAKLGVGPKAEKKESEAEGETGEMGEAAVQDSSRPASPSTDLPNTASDSLPAVGEEGGQIKAPSS